MEPTGDMPELPDLRDIEIPYHVRPKVLGKHMTNIPIVTMFVSHVHYMYDGRHLAREETSSLMREYWYNTGYYKMNHDLLDKFEDDTAELTIALRPLGDDRRQAFKAYVDHLFRNLLKEKPEVEARARIISGFPGRFPRIDFGGNHSGLVLRQQELEPYQYLFHYAAVNWGKERLNQQQITGVLVFHYKFDSTIKLKGIKNCSEALADQDHRITKELAPIAEKYRDFFKQKVFEEFEEYEKSKSQGSSSKSLLGPDSPPPPQPPAAGPSRNPGSLPYDPLRDT